MSTDDGLHLVLSCSDTTMILYLQVVYTGRAGAPLCHRISLKVVQCVYVCVSVCVVLEEYTFQLTGVLTWQLVF